MSRTTISEAKTLSWKQISVTQKSNSRRKLRDIPELAKNIEENGLKSALLVTNGGDDSHPYTLVAGFRRAAALELLNWGNKPVNVIVVEDAQGSNLIENILREPLPALDLAKRLFEMKEGTYYVPGDDEKDDADEGKKKWTNAELGKLLSKSQSHITNYVRVHEALTDEVKDLVGPWNPPGRLLFMWASKPAGKQLEMAEEWVVYMKALETGGRRRKSKGADGSATSNSAKPSKATVEEKYDQLVWKAENVKGEAGRTAAFVADALSWAMGGDGAPKRFPTDVLSGDDVKAYAAAVKEEAKAEADAKKEAKAAKEAAE